MGLFERNKAKNVRKLTSGYKKGKQEDEVVIQPSNEFTSNNVDGVENTRIDTDRVENPIAESSRVEVERVIYQEPNNQVQQPPINQQHSTITQEAFNVQVPSESSYEVYSDYREPIMEQSSLDKLFEEEAPSKEIVSVNGIDVDLNKLKKIDCPLIETEKIRLDLLNDPYGYVSDRIEEAERGLGVSVLPLDLIGIPEGMNRLQRHDIITIHGRKYSSSNCKVVNEQALNELTNYISDQLNKFKNFIVPLTFELEIQGCKFLTHRLNTYELHLLRGKFIDYRPIAKVDPDTDYLYLVFEYFKPRLRW